MKALVLLTVFTVLLYNVKGQSAENGMSASGMILTSGTLAKIGFDQRNDAGEEGQTNTFVKIRLLSGPLSQDVTGSVVPLNIEQLENYVFTTFRTIPQELWQVIDEIEDPAEYEDEEQDFDNSIIRFTIRAGDEEYEIPTNDIIIDDSINEGPEDFILVLDDVEPSDIVELDNIYEGILVFTINDDDEEACKTSQDSATISIIVAVLIVLVVVIAAVGIVVLVVIYKKRMKIAINGEVFVPHNYENPVFTNIEMSSNVLTSQENIAQGSSREHVTTTSMDANETYEVVDQQTTANTTETDMTYEEVEQQPTATHKKTRAATEQQTAAANMDTDDMGYQVMKEPSTSTNMNTNVAYGVVP